jgi:hypothetical protein
MTAGGSPAPQSSEGANYVGHSERRYPKLRRVPNQGACCVKSLSKLAAVAAFCNELTLISSFADPWLRAASTRFPK